MSRWYYGILVLLTSVGCASVKPTQAPVFQPQLGIRISSSVSTPDLLPRNHDRALALNERGPAVVPERMPLSLTAGPSVSEIGGGVMIEKITKPRATRNDYRLLSMRPTPLTEDAATLASAEGQIALLTDSRFSKQFTEQFHEEMPGLWQGRFRSVMELNPGQIVGIDQATSSVPNFDPFAEERNASAGASGERYWRRAIRGALQDTDMGAAITNDMKSWRDEPLSFVLAFLGGAIEQETPEGGRFIVGPSLNELNDSQKASDVVRVRYILGPFEARAETREVWIRYKIDWQNFTFFVRTARDYFDSDSSLQLGVNAIIDEDTTWRIFGGNSVRSESLTGISPYPNDPRENNRKLGIVSYIEHRF